jgi:putative heme-binding domain-containing protein
MKLVCITVGAFLCALPAVSQDKAEIEKGLAIYRSNCAFCHGIDGKGGRGPDLVSRQLVHGDSDAALTNVIRKGVPGSTMPAFQFEEEEIARLIAFMRHLRGNAAPAVVKLGDAGSGRTLYVKNGCANCHRVGLEGSVYGPELTRIGVSRSVDYLRESIVHPAADIPPAYEGVTVVTKDGKKISGIRVNEDTFSIQLRDLSQAFRMFSKDQLREVVYEKNSMMPAYSKLSKQELVDLLAYMVSLQGASKGSNVKQVEGIR